MKVLEVYHNRWPASTPRTPAGPSTEGEQRALRESHRVGALRKRQVGPVDGVSAGFEFPRVFF